MSPYRRGGVWWASIPQADGGGRKRVSLDTTNRHEAMEREAEMRNASARQRLGLEVRERNPRHLTVSQAVDVHLEKGAARQRQHDMLTLTLGKHVKRDPLGDLLLEEVTPAVVAEWLDRREDEGASPTTANRLKSNLSAVFRTLIERQLWRGENPAKAVRQRKQEPPKSKVLPPDAVPRLIEVAPTDGWRLAFALAAYAGLRRGEIERLQWADVDLERRLIRISKTKTDVPRVVGIHRDLLALLQDGKHIGSVIPKAGWSKSAVIVRNALKRAEVNVGDAQACFHSLRGTWATQLIECGADPFLVRLMGWGPPKGDVMAQHYARPTRALVEAVDRLWWPSSTTLKIESHSSHRG